MRILYILLAVAAAAVVAIAVIALREDDPVAPPVTAPRSQPVAPAVTPSAPTTAAAVAAQPASVETIDVPAEPELITDEVDLMMLLREMGLDGLDRELRDWGASRGYPQTDATGQMLYDQPYEQYDNETLGALGASGDMWALQILAKRISRSDPAEALELYRQAAIHGSVYAMTEMTALYKRIGEKRHEVEFKSDEVALEQVYAMRDAPVAPSVSAYAWAAVAEVAGWDPMHGSIAASQAGRNLSETEIAEACDLALGLYEEIRTQRDAIGLGDYPRDPPPVVYEPGVGGMGSQCYNDEPAYDLSDCRQVRVRAGEEGANVWFCGKQ